MKNKKFDAIILGAGIAGLTTASALGRAGKKVVVLDKKGVRGESTPAAAGILDPFLEMEPGHPLFRLNREAFFKYPAWIRELRKRTGMDPGYQDFGMLFMAMTETQLGELRKRYEWQKNTGIRVEMKTAAQVRKAEPAASGRVLGGLNYPVMARVQPRKLLPALEKYGRSYDVEISRYSGILKIVLSKGSLTGVQAGAAFYEAPVVVNAMGSWAGVSPLASLRTPISPVRGQIVVVKSLLKISTILHTLDGGYIVPWDSGFAGKANSMRQYLLGSTVEHAGFRPIVTPDGIRSIRRRIETIVPALSEAKVVETWSGLRPFPLTERPLIGPSKIPGYFLALGYYRSGILISFLAGSLLAEAIISGKTPALIKDFDPRKLL